MHPSRKPTRVGCVERFNGKKRQKERGSGKGSRGGHLTKNEWHKLDAKRVGGLLLWLWELLSGSSSRDGS